MVRYFVKKSFNEDLQEVTYFPEGHAWVYGTEVSDQDLQRVAEETGLDANVLRDVRDLHELPRVEYSKGATYVFLRIPRSIRGGAMSISVPLLFVVRSDILVTLSTAKYITPEELSAEQRFSMRSSSGVFLQLMSQIFTQYGREIQKYSNLIYSVQQRLQKRSITNKDFVKFVTIERALAEFYTNLVASKAALDRLSDNKHGLLTEKEIEYLDDILLYVNQLTVAVQSGSQSITSIRDTFSTMSDNALNQRMKTLTLLTMFLTVPNVIFGMFGMNVLLPVDPRDPWVFLGIGLASVIVILLAYLAVRKYKI